MAEEKLVFMRLMEETYRASQEVQERDSEKVYIGGASQMLESPEFANVDKMKALLKAFEDKYKMLKLLDRSVAAQGIKVFIGSENPFFEMQGCSMVVGNYKAGANVVGTLGVIGPTQDAVQTGDTGGGLYRKAAFEACWENGSREGSKDDGEFDDVQEEDGSDASRARRRGRCASGARPTR